MNYKCVLTLDDNQLELLKSFCTSTLGVEPIITKVHPKEVDAKTFLRLYYSYLLEQIDMTALRRSLGMGKTKFHEVLKSLRNQGYPLPSKADFKRYNPLLNPFHIYDYSIQNSALPTNELTPTDIYFDEDDIDFDFDKENIYFNDDDDDFIMDGEEDIDMP